MAGQGGMRGQGCMLGGMHGQGVCMAEGHAWPGECAWPRGCV